MLGHSDIAFDRKKDPGEKFPWKFLSTKGIGFWHNINYEYLKIARKVKITKGEKTKFNFYLSKIGYFTNSKISKNLIKLNKSFQRRFRPELIDGKIDKECFLIAKNLSKN